MRGIVDRSFAAMLDELWTLIRTSATMN